MTREDAQRLLLELDVLEVRCVAAGAGLPGDEEIATLRADILARRAGVVELLAQWHQRDVAEAYAQAPRH